ncbi:MAG: aminopeptidase [Verrucomicrobiales bacterium]
MMPWLRVRRSFSRLLCCAFCALAGCETAHFYSQGLHGQWQITRGQRLNSAMIADSATPTRLRVQLEKVERLRAFADWELGLSAREQYAAYKDLNRTYVAWAIYAAPEFSLEAKTWWYPFVGRLKYRGWFSPLEAKKRAQRLMAQGYDIYVAGVPAYSTLGWLKDPVLNTFVYLPDTTLAELLFHELAHQRIFIHGDTDFNEAFATATGREGVRRWLRAEGRSRDLDKYDQAQKREREFIQLIRQTRAELQNLYTQEFRPPEGLLRLEKAKRLALLRTRYDALKRDRWSGAGDYDVWFTGPVNNARLNSIATYYDLVPAFQALLGEQHGDLEKFYREVERLGDLRKSARKEELQRLPVGAQ